MHHPVFIIGAGRSGTTAMVELLKKASNGSIHTEQDPKLCIGSRMQYEKILPYPDEYIFKSKNVFIENVVDNDLIYIDKNPNYVHFIKEMSSLWKCKFVFLVRDGRDVVRSAINFHKKRGPGYQRYEDDFASTVTQPEENFWDFSRLRPRRDDDAYSIWRSMSTFEKFTWAWVRFNEILLKEMHSLEKEDYLLIHMNSLDSKRVSNIYDFCSLKGFSEDKITTILSARVNTTKLPPEIEYPHWKYWSKDQYALFDSYAANMMKQLKFY